MNPDFKFNFDEMLDPKPERAYDSSEGTGNAESRDYATASHVRNLCFKWPDGNLLFLNYSYLVAGSYSRKDSTITLTFTTHVIKLKGSRLEILAYELVQQLPRIIECIDDRYNALEDQKPVVNTIEVTTQQ